jgi:hypothetical protein
MNMHKSPWANPAILEAIADESDAVAVAKSESASKLNTHTPTYTSSQADTIGTLATRDLHDFWLRTNRNLDACAADGFSKISIMTMFVEEFIGRLLRTLKAHQTFKKYYNYEERVRLLKTIFEEMTVEIEEIIKELDK